MKPVGKQLQEARLAKKWTPELAARETKIKVDRLRDLEADNYTHFTSPAYARGFVRTYARALGLDEYKILRQLDNKLPDDDSPTLVTESGVGYLPENSMPPRVAHRDLTGLYIVMALGSCVFLVILFVLWEAYRVGELPSYFAEAPTADVEDKSLDTNGAPLAVDTNAAPQALPVNPNEAPPAPKAEAVDPAALAADTNAAPAPVPDVSTAKAVKALPVDPSELASGTNAAPDTEVPLKSVKALPVDPSELTNAAPVAPVGNPPVPNAQTATTTPASPSTNTPPRALPVDPAELANAPAEAAPVATNLVAQAAPPPPQPVATTVSARQSNSGPVVMPSGPALSPSSTTSVSDAAAGSSMTNTSSQSVAPPDANKRLILTATQDSFVRVASLDAPDKALYSSVLHTGQSVGFDGRKFSVHVGVPSAVNIQLDGVNYGPHSDQDAPETFTVESHLP